MLLHVMDQTCFITKVGDWRVFSCFPFGGMHGGWGWKWEVVEESHFFFFFFFSLSRFAWTQLCLHGNTR